MKLKTWLEKHKNDDVSLEEIKELEEYILEASTKNVYVGSHLSDYSIGTYNGEEPNWQKDKDIISAMIKSPVIKSNIAKKVSSISGIFRSKINWSIDCSDEDIKIFIEKSLEKILPKLAADMVRSMLVEGTSYQELMWEESTLYELGINTNKTVKYIIPKTPITIDPTTIKSIVRTLEGKYLGIKQRSKKHPLEILIPSDKTLICSNSLYNKMIGDSILPDIYSLWFWHEVTIRSMNRYMEDMGKPKFIVRYPGRHNILDENNQPVPVMKHAREVAQTISTTQSVSIPSTTDEHGKYLFDISILSDTSNKQQNFIEVINLLESKIKDAINNYPNEAESSIYDEYIIYLMLYNINTYFIPRIIEYNFGLNSPKAFIKTSTINNQDKEFLFKVLSIAGNSATVQKFYEVVDWKTFASLSKIPVLNEKDIPKTPETVVPDTTQDTKEETNIKNTNNESNTKK